jgi:glycine cleavage system H protein
MPLGSLLDYRFTAEHGWITGSADSYTIGISDYAQDALGDVVFLQLPKVGQRFRSGESFGEIESVKSVTEVYAPVDLDIVAFNEQTRDEPGLLNTDPYGDGWLIKVRASRPDPLDGLLDLVRYRAELVEDIAHVFYLDDRNKIHYLPAVRAEDGILMAQSRQIQAMVTGSLIDVSRLGRVDLADEFQELINMPNATGAQIRRFFTLHPEFLLGTKYHDAHADFALRPQITLHEESAQDLQPDFILRPVAGLANDAKIVDLGLPSDPVARHPSAGGGLYNNIVEAVGQLRAYARYFDATENREYVQRTLGFTPYLPRLTLIVGKKIEFDTGGLVRNAMRDSAPVEVVTYNDVLRKYRQLLG